MSATPELQPAAAAALATWHEIVAKRDVKALPPLLHRDAMFRSPMAFKPYHSAQAVELVLKTALSVFEDFTYHREFLSLDGHSVILEFSARIGDRRLKGVDIFRFDDQGLIAEMEVMVRPGNALMALGQTMAERAGPGLKALLAGMS